MKLIRLLSGPIACLALLATSFPGCHVETVEVAEWDLDDSLAGYDRVEIVILDAADTAKVLQPVHDGPLRPGTALPALELKEANGKAFVVRIRGYEDSLLAYEKWIHRTPGPGGDSLRVEATPAHTLPGSPPLLLNLTASAGRLDPPFSPDSLRYRLLLSHAESLLVLSATLPDAMKGAVVDKAPLPADGKTPSLRIAVGTATLSATVTAAGGKTRTYVLDVVRAASAEARLSLISLSSPAIPLAFHPDTLDYAVTVPVGTSSIGLQVKSLQGDARIRIGGDSAATGTAGRPLTLARGENTLPIVVLAQDGASTRTYRVRITRPTSSNANLAGLSIPGAQLFPAFHRDQLQYRAWIAPGRENVVLTPTLEDRLGTLSLDGTPIASGAPAEPIVLTRGTRKVTLSVVAEDGKTGKYYDLYLTVPPDGAAGN